MLRLALILFILLSTAVRVSADDKAVKKFKNLTPEQVRDLPEKVRSSELPIMYSMAAQRGLAKDAELAFQMELNALMYPGLHDYRAALIAFQKDLGDEPTGVLTVWQIHNLEKRADMQRLGEVGFPTNLQSFVSGGYASIKGTLVILEDKIAWPVNRTIVTCTKDTMTCEFVQMILALPDKNSWSQRYQVLDPTIETFIVTRWQGSAVDAVSSQDSDACRARSLTLDFKTKEFFYLTRNGSGDCKALGTEMPKLAKPRIAQIIDGSKVIESTFAEIRAAAYAALSSEFRRRVELLQAAERKK